jgi:hypothetical protein
MSHTTKGLFAFEAESAKTTCGTRSQPTVVAHIGFSAFAHTCAWARCHQAITGATSSPIVLSWCADTAHQAMRLADAVVVLNLSGDSDQHTLHEVCVAYNTGKPIQWLEDWSMYCPACECFGPEAEHFFHQALSLSALNHLLSEMTGEHLPYLPGQIVDWYGQIVPLILLPNGLPALQVDLACPFCDRSTQTVYAIAGENGAWAILVDAYGLPLADLCAGEGFNQRWACTGCAKPSPQALPIYPVHRHFAVGSPDGPVLRSGEHIQIVLAGQYLVGRVRWSERGDFFQGEDQTVCGLYPCMQVVLQEVVR